MIPYQLWSSASRNPDPPCLIYGSNACGQTDGYIKRYTVEIILIDNER